MYSTLTDTSVIAVIAESTVQQMKGILPLYGGWIPIAMLGFIIIPLLTQVIKIMVGFEYTDKYDKICYVPGMKEEINVMVEKGGVKIRCEALGYESFVRVDDVIDKNWELEVLNERKRLELILLEKKKEWELLNYRINAIK